LFKAKFFTTVNVNSLNSVVMDDSEISKPVSIRFDFLKKNLDFELRAIFTVYTSAAAY